MLQSSMSMRPNEYNVPAPADQMVIHCLHCDKQLEVGRKTQTVTCKYYHKPLKLQDESIKQYFSRRSVETLGIVTVEKKGDLVTDLINCGGAVIRGKVRGTIKSRGPVFVGPEAE